MASTTRTGASVVYTAKLASVRVNLTMTHNMYTITQPSHPCLIVQHSPLRHVRLVIVSTGTSICVHWSITEGDRTKQGGCAKALMHAWLVVTVSTQLWHVLLCIKTKQHPTAALLPFGVCCANSPQVHITSHLSHVAYQTKFTA